MAQEPRPEEILDITGPEGETLFWHALACVAVEHAPKLQGELDELWVHYKDITDERLLSIVAALCVENAIQELLEGVGPGFTQVRDDADFTFSLKIKTARALRVIPSRILGSCDLIRQVRNEFAHHLDKKQLSHLDNKRHLRKLAAQLTGFNRAMGDGASHGEMFKALVSDVLVALRVYIQHVRRLREYLGTETFRASFKKWAEGK